VNGVGGMGGKTMILRFIIAIFVLAGTWQSSFSQTAEVYRFGIGLESCAHWLSNPQTESAGANWILGYWSGMNIFHSDNHMVGSKTDGDAIIGEVRKICNQSPSTKLNEAISAVYLNFQQQNK
jgi:hypothetical protein